MQAVFPSDIYILSTSAIFSKLFNLGLICIFLIPINGFPPAAENNPIPVQAYWDLIANLETALASYSQIAPVDLLEYANQLEEITQLSLPSGEAISIDNSFLIAQLRQENLDNGHLQYYLNSLTDSLETWAQTSFSDDSIITLEEILSASEFQWKTTQPSLLAQWINKLIQQLLDFFSRLIPDGESQIALPDVNTMVTVASILMILLILGFVLKKLASGFVSEAVLENEGDRQSEITDSKIALKRAQQLSQDGDYRNAVRYLYLSSLLLLEERGMLRYDRSKTNREYLNAISNQPTLEEAFEEVINTYDRVWYGYKNLEEEDFKRYSQRVSNLNKLK